MKKSRMKMALAVALMMALPQISLAQSALLGTLKNAASTALANSNNKKVSAVTSILTGVEKMKTVNDSVLVGTWAYSQPCVTVETKNLLSDIGGEAVSSKVEPVLKAQFEKWGIKPGKFSVTLKEDKKGSVTNNDKTDEFTWAVEDSCVVFTQQDYNAKVNAKMNGNTLQLTVSAEKMLAMLSYLNSNATNSDDSFADLLSSIKNVKGLYVGMKFDKVVPSGESTSAPAAADTTAAAPKKE